jgi:hypothetical protein
MAQTVLIHLFLALLFAHQLHQLVAAEDQAVMLTALLGKLAVQAAVVTHTQVDTLLVVQERLDKVTLAEMLQQDQVQAAAVRERRVAAQMVVLDRLRIQLGVLLLAQVKT